MSVIPDEAGRDSTEVPDSGLAFMMAILLVLAVVTALFT